MTTPIGPTGVAECENNDCDGIDCAWCSYVLAVQWLALQDDGGFDAGWVESTIGAKLLAVAFSTDPSTVAQHIVQRRAEEWPQDAAEAFNVALTVTVEPGQAPQMLANGRQVPLVEAIASDGATVWRPPEGWQPHCPRHLHNAYNWTEGRGELLELRELAGDALQDYCAGSAGESLQQTPHPHDAVTAGELEALHHWLRNP